MTELTEYDDEDSNALWGQLDLNEIVSLFLEPVRFFLIVDDVILFTLLLGKEIS